MIYLITNTTNGKRYIGKTAKTLEERWQMHMYSAAAGRDTYLYRAIRKYGPDNFTVEFLAEGLDNEEVAAIAEHAPEYNMTKGGDGGDTSSSPNFTRGLAASPMHGSHNPMYGRCGESSPNYGRKKTAEQIANHRLGYKGKRTPAMIAGVHYDSTRDAAKAIGRSDRYVRTHNEYD